MEDKISYPSENMKELDLEALTSPGAQKVNNIRIVCISDTHSTVMDPLSIPDGDILIHAGDFTNFGEVRYINLFNEFLGCLPHRNKIVIAGNHDILFDPGDFKLKNVYWDLLRPDLHSSEYVKGLLTNCMYLEDSGCKVQGYNIYGTPWQPEYFNNAFNLGSLEERESKWGLIPVHTDILIVHGPPYGIGDTTKSGLHTGCQGLLRTIQERVQPLLVVFGHIHEGYGAWNDGITTYLNASSIDFDKNPVNKPLVIDLPMKA